MFVNNSLHVNDVIIDTDIAHFVAQQVRPNFSSMNCLLNFFKNYS